MPFDGVRAHRLKRAAAAMGVALIVAGLCYGLVRSVRELGRGRDTVAPVGGAPAVPNAKPEQNPEAVRAVRHSALMAEMLQVVFELVPEQAAQRPEYLALLNSLHQGASLEGIYRGLTASASFRSLEKTQGAASPAALAVFGRLASVFANASVAPQFDTTPGGLPRVIRSFATARIVSPDPHLPIDRFRPRPGQESDGSAPAPVSTPSASPPPNAEQISGQFVGFSAATLRRVLGELALNELEHAGTLRAETYVRWVLAFCEIEGRPDFGLASRNRCEAEFHRAWALGTTSDAIAWEVLNRIHRLIIAKDRGA